MMGRQPTFDCKPSSKSLIKRRLIWHEEKKKLISGSKSCLQAVCQAIQMAQFNMNKGLWLFLLLKQCGGLFRSEALYYPLEKGLADSINESCGVPRNVSLAAAFRQALTVKGLPVSAHGDS